MAHERIRDIDGSCFAQGHARDMRSSLAEHGAFSAAAGLHSDSITGAALRTASDRLHICDSQSIHNWKAGHDVPVTLCLKCADVHSPAFAIAEDTVWAGAVTELLHFSIHSPQCLADIVQGVHVPHLPKRRKAMRVQARVVPVIDEDLRGVSDGAVVRCGAIRTIRRARIIAALLANNSVHSKAHSAAGVGNQGRGSLIRGLVGGPGLVHSRGTH